MYQQGTPDSRGSLYGREMDNSAEVRAFLTSRRAKLTPEAAGLPAGLNRRVAGLRRSEVALLAGVSVEYYARLERGAVGGASAAVLDAIARSLQLDDTERAHLLDLARAADGIPTSGRVRRRATKQSTSRASLQWTLDAITDGVAFVRNSHQDLLAMNALGRAFYSPIIGDGGRTPNMAPSSLTPPPETSIPTGTCSRKCVSRSCVLRPAGTRTTADCRTWSASCPCAATSFEPYGRHTMSAPMVPGRNGSTIPSSAN